MAALILKRNAGVPASSAMVISRGRGKRLKT
jgi:hypothetical protein